MSLVKFSEYLDYLCLASAMEELTDDEVIVEWTEEEWNNLTVEERDVLEAEAIDGGWVDVELDEYKARNTMQRRKTQVNKDRLKFSNRSQKLRDKIDRNKGANKVHITKLRKKRLRINKAKIAQADRVFGGKVKSKFTKTSPSHKRGGR